MSRIGSAPIQIPTGVTVELDGNVVVVKGSKGELRQDIPKRSIVKIADGVINVERKSEEKLAKAEHGLTRSLINNMVVGVSEGFEKELEVNGVGFKIAVQGSELVMSLGFSHEIRYNIPKDVDVSIEKMNIKVTGISKQRVGQIAAEIREFKKPEPYKGKGIKYVDERIVRKAGKSGAAE